MKTKNVFAALAGTAVICASAIQMSAYSVDKTMDVKVNITPIISLAVTPSTTSAINLAPNAADTTSIYASAVINTNSVAGYSLTLADNDTNTNLVNSSLTSATIPTAAGKPVAGTSSWAACIAGATACASNTTSNWVAIPASNGTAISVLNVDSSDGVYATERTATVYFGIGASSSAVAGTYSDTVKFTAAAK